MIEKGYDLKEYFQSNLPVYQIIDTSYPSLHVDDSQHIYACNAENPLELLTEASYNKFIGDTLAKDDGETNPVAIEYFLINIPETIQKKELIPTMTQISTMELFETTAFKTIIEHKWKTYTFAFFLRQFIIFMFFIVVFCIDLYYQTYFGEDIEGEYSSFSIGLKAVGLAILSYFISYEIRSALKQGISEYASDFWNFFDFLLVSIYITMCAVDIFKLSQSIEKLLLCAILLLAFIKLNFFLRIFEGFSFMVSMMQGVFGDLKYFMAFFLVTVIEFGMLFTVLVKSSDVYDSVGSVGYFLMAFRTSLGDFDLDNYGSSQIESDNILEIIILRWLVWGLGVFIMNIVFMNFIIAVISESYEKVDMIAERELHFSEEDFKNPEYFPKYLIIRKPVEGEEEGAEWSGFIKDLKAHITKTAIRSKADLQARVDLISKAVLENQKMAIENQKNMRELLRIVRKDN